MKLHQNISPSHPVLKNCNPCVHVLPSLHEEFLPLPSHVVSPFFPKQSACSMQNFCFVGTGEPKPAVVVIPTSLYDLRAAEQCARAAGNTSTRAFLQSPRRTGVCSSSLTSPHSIASPSTWPMPARGWVDYVVGLVC